MKLFGTSHIINLTIVFTYIHASFCLVCNTHNLLSRYFVVFRNGSQDERLDKKTRLHLLELIELRAKLWQGSDYMSQYYRHRGTHAEVN